MHYQGNIFRPPSEADSILLQVTTGCSHNKCTFCGMYKGSRFSIKDQQTIDDDIAFAARYCQRQSRLFLCDGDALILPQQRLLDILTAINQQLPWVRRISCYANSKSIRRKDKAQLQTLRDKGLTLLYMGLESGDDLTLAQISKGADAARMIDCGRKVREAGIKLSLTVLLGLAGRDGWQQHARETGRVLTSIDPEFVGALSIMLVPGTPLHSAWQKGSWLLPSAPEILRELREMIAATDLTGGMFHANHASNYLPIKARLPRDKEKTLALIDQALAGEIQLKPEFMRGL